MEAKPLEAGQSFIYMLGYIQKDTGMPHYRMESYNVPEDELQEGRRNYDDVRVDFIEGKIAINKANLIKHMYTFYTRCGLSSQAYISFSSVCIGMFTDPRPAWCSFFRCCCAETLHLAPYLRLIFSNT